MSRFIRRNCALLDCYWFYDLWLLLVETSSDLLSFVSLDLILQLFEQFLSYKHLTSASVSSWSSPASSFISLFVSSMLVWISRASSMMSVILSFTLYSPLRKSVAWPIWSAMLMSILATSSWFFCVRSTFFLVLISWITYSLPRSFSLFQPATLLRPSPLSSYSGPYSL